MPTPSLEELVERRTQLREWWPTLVAAVEAEFYQTAITFGELLARYSPYPDGPEICTVVARLR